MAQRLRFLAGHELGEDLLLGRDAASKYCETAAPTASSARPGAARPRATDGDAGLRELQEGFRLRMFARQIAHAADGLALSFDELAREVARPRLSSESGSIDDIEQRAAVERRTPEPWRRKRSC